MNKYQLFQSLSEEDVTTLLKLLRNAYDFLGHDDRDIVFGQYVQERPAGTILPACTWAYCQDFTFTHDYFPLN